MITTFNFSLLLLLGMFVVLSVLDAYHVGIFADYPQCYEKDPILFEQCVSGKP